MYQNTAGNTPGGPATNHLEGGPVGGNQNGTVPPTDGSHLASDPYSHSSHTANTLDPGVHNNAGYDSGATTGPNSSNFAKKLDPRVDSTTGAQTSMTGANSGPHSSNAANKFDPRVDSTTGATGPTQGPPHSSNKANKVDPRVDDSMGGTTHATGAATGLHSGTGKEGTDAHGTPPTYDETHGSEHGHRDTGTPGRTTGVTGGAGNTSKPGGGIRGAAASLHGMGEMLRGTAGEAVDRAMNDQEGVLRNEEIRQKGEREIETKQFGKDARR